MRYIVKFWNGRDIINDLRTNNFLKVLERIRELKESHEEVWYADSILERMVG